MKKALSILFIFFLFSIIICVENDTELNKQKKENKKNIEKEIKNEKKEEKEKKESKDNTKKDSKQNDKEEKEEKEEKEQEQEEEQVEEEKSGFMISEKIFDEKLQQILEEKQLKPKKKITKEQLRTIFAIIYKKEEKPGEERGVDPETGWTPEEQSKQYMDSVFNEVTKSLDYDDKIRVKEIKEWIHPNRVQEAYGELLRGLAETMGYL